MSVVHCRKCEAEMVVSQPNKFHYKIDRKILNWKDYIKSTSKCKKCGTANIFYWSRLKD
ncbi:MAG: hypothetical protein ACPKPY_03460 [Nitrososphaeraceae archaeon]